MEHVQNEEDIHEEEEAVVESDEPENDSEY